MKLQEYYPIRFKLSSVNKMISSCLLINKLVHNYLYLIKDINKYSIHNSFFNVSFLIIVFDRIKYSISKVLFMYGIIFK